MANLRRSIINRRRKRKEKLGKLRRLYIQATTNEEKERILEKVFKVAPHLRRDDFLLSVKQAKQQ